MSDPTDTTAAPIVVSGTPTQPQIEAGIRQAVLILGSIAGAVGASKVAGEANTLLTIVGPVAALVAFVWGQYATWKHARQAASMANALPNSVATTK